MLTPLHSTQHVILAHTGDARNNRKEGVIREETFIGTNVRDVSIA